MNVSLGEQTQSLLEARMMAGGYRSHEETIAAGLAALENSELFGDFAPGEWDKAIAAGDASAAAGGFRPHEEVFDALRRRVEKRGSP